MYPTTTEIKDRINILKKEDEAFREEAQHIATLRQMINEELEILEKIKQFQEAYGGQENE